MFFASSSIRVMLARLLGFGLPLIAPGSGTGTIGYNQWRRGAGWVQLALGKGALSMMAWDAAGSEQCGRQYKNADQPPTMGKSLNQE